MSGENPDLPCPPRYRESCPDSPRSWTRAGPPMLGYGGSWLDNGSSHARSRRSLRPPRGLAIIVAATLLSAGGALAATDPMGWWSTSPQPGAISLHNQCPRPHSGRSADPLPERPCRRRLQLHRASATHAHQPRVAAGARVTFLATTSSRRSRLRRRLSPRAGLLSYIARKRAQGTMSVAAATRFRADLARVPDSFFIEFRLASSYGTFESDRTNSRGQTIAPPPPASRASWCVSRPAGTLSCQNLNGDQNAPIGAGVYGAVPGPGWRVVPRSDQTGGGVPPGLHFTTAETRVLIDMLRYATVTQSHGTDSRAPTA